MTTDVRLNTRWIREVWIPALRSGDYDQAHMYLYPYKPGNNRPTMCCLGVATDCAIKEGILPGQWTLYTHSVTKSQRFVYGKSHEEGKGSSHLPPEMEEFLGMGSDGGVEGFRYLSRSAMEEGSLWRINDYHSEDFTYIANELERLCDWAEANGRAQEDNS